MIRIFQINDCDWFAAETLEHAIEYAKQEYDYDDDTIEEPRELTDEEMDRLQFRFTDDDDRPLEKMSFRAALAKRIAAGEQFPAMFASSEY